MDSIWEWDKVNLSLLLLLFLPTLQISTLGQGTDRGKDHTVSLEFTRIPINQPPVHVLPDLRRDGKDSDLITMLSPLIINTLNNPKRKSIHGPGFAPLRQHQYLVSNMRNHKNHLHGQDLMDLQTAHLVNNNNINIKHLNNGLVMGECQLPPTRTRKWIWMMSRMKLLKKSMRTMNRLELVGSGAAEEELGWMRRGFLA
jgi:hypothetical protein